MGRHGFIRCGAVANRAAAVANSSDADAVQAELGANMSVADAKSTAARINNCSKTKTAANRLQPLCRALFLSEPLPRLFILARIKMPRLQPGDFTHAESFSKLEPVLLAHEGDFIESHQAFHIKFDAP